MPHCEFKKKWIHFSTSHLCTSVVWEKLLWRKEWRSHTTSIGSSEFGDLSILWHMVHRYVLRENSSLLIFSWFLKKIVACIKNHFLAFLLDGLEKKLHFWDWFFDLRNGFVGFFENFQFASQKNIYYAYKSRLFLNFFLI